jgi:hypothetical protein
MLTLMLATALAAAPAPTPMPCGPDCSPQAMADCPMGSMGPMGRMSVPAPERHEDRR